MQEIVFHIGMKETLGIIISVCGTMVSLAWFASGRFSKWDSEIFNLKERFNSFEGKLVEIEGKIMEIATRR